MITVTKEEKEKQKRRAKFIFLPSRPDQTKPQRKTTVKMQKKMQSNKQ